MDHTIAGECECDDSHFQEEVKWKISRVLAPRMDHTHGPLGEKAASGEEWMGHGSGLPFPLPSPQLDDSCHR